MPRQARIDAPGAVHHVMVRGIERRKIFGDKSILCQEDPYLRELVRYLHLNPYPRTVMARSILVYWAHRELGLSTVDLSKRLKLSQPSVSQSIKRGEGLIIDRCYTLF